MSDPAPDQELPEEQVPAEQPEAEADPDAPVVDNTLPEEQPPRGPGANRGKDEEARANAPGQQDKDFRSP